MDLYCNQYFDVEEIAEQDKLKLASYYLDGMAAGIKIIWEAWEDK